MNDNEENNEEGSVWTSYSDMFTTMAIIFLVMFVFALLRSGVSTLTAIKEKKDKENFIKGQVSKKSNIESKNIMNSMENEISEMKEFDEVIDVKIKMINSFSKKMKKHKELLKKSLERQSITHAALKKSQQILKNKEAQIKRQNKELKQLDFHISNYKKDINSLKNMTKKLKTEKQKITSALIEEQNENTLKTKEIRNERSETKRVKNEIKRKNIQFNKLENLNHTLHSSLSNKNNTIKQISRSIQERDQELKRVIKKVSYLEKHSKYLKNIISKKESNVKSLQKTVSQLSSTQKSNESSINKSLAKIKSLENGLKNEKSKNLNNRKTIESLKNNTRSMKGKLKDANNRLANAKEKNNRISRGIASVRKSIRSQIGQEIAKKLQNENLKVKVDPTTGSVTLSMDDAFLFKKNDFKLSERAKVTLKRIIPLYVEAIFNDPKTYKYIECVNIIGHASPRYKNKYTKTTSSKNQEAYIYNMDLSTNRAKEIVKFIFSRNFGAFNNKFKFREKVSVIGRSFSNPIKRSIASVQNEDCGEYDCSSSRRVEIRFTLKEDTKIWDKIENIN